MTVPIKRKIGTTGASGSYIITLPKSWVEERGLEAGDFVLIDVTNVLTIRSDKKKEHKKEALLEEKKIDQELKEKVIQVLRSVGKINPKKLAEEHLSLSNYSYVVPYLEALLEEGKIKTKSFRWNSKIEWIGKTIEEPEITYDLFLNTLVKETEKWIDIHNPHSNIASIPALREIICSKLDISDEKFDLTLYEFMKLRIVSLSGGIGSGFKGRPIKTSLGDKMYAIKIYEKRVPPSYSGRIL